MAKRQARRLILGIHAMSAKKLILKEKDLEQRKLSLNK